MGVTLREPRRAAPCGRPEACCLISRAVQLVGSLQCPLKGLKIFFAQEIDVDIGEKGGVESLFWETVRRGVETSRRLFRHSGSRRRLIGHVGSSLSKIALQPRDEALRVERKCVEGDKVWCGSSRRRHEERLRFKCMTYQRYVPNSTTGFRWGGHHQSRVVVVIMTSPVPVLKI